ncbi:condensin subunit E [Pseudoduganella sp. FT25W]|uniref:Condensin subunit E n=1 Tax=Duganella alba TaxID=2666081 RepID=A0A6L5QA96_9BURK|nr:chromosome partition protein MukE [Duganella alba]MRX06510.1 condensin subunit E [Duganella alba]MRX14904.1 condensin subunit E [Duganella alba]
MIYHTLEEVIEDPMFARADLALRRGRHIGPDYDTGLFDFLTSTSKLMERFYGRFSVALLQGSEGYFYLLPDRLAVPPPLGLRKLSVMEMLTGQTLALMRLDHKWLETNYRIPDLAIFGLMEQLLGEPGLTRLAGRRRGKDAGQDARKLRETFAVALRTLERLGFVRREGRGELGVVIPLAAVMRFADPVRGAEALDLALERLIAEGQIKEDDEDADPDGG